MDMNQKRKIRQEKKNDDQQSSKTAIQWFPGHMTRAKREMMENLQKVDMVIEIRDCRIPLSSANPMLDEILKNKPRLIILSKKDKGEPKEIEAWIDYLKNDQTAAIAMDLLKEKVGENTTAACKSVMKPMIDRMIRKGIRPRAIRAMVVGIPNVGKSTFINRIAGKKVAETSDRPGVTRALKWVKCNADLELLDTPGVLWPKFEDEQVGKNLALTGAIRDEVLPLEEIAVYGIERLIKEYPNRLKERYEVEIVEDPYKMIEAIARKKNWLKSGNEPDWARCYRVILNDIRDGKLGTITWEKINGKSA